MCLLLNLLQLSMYKNTFDKQYVSNMLHKLRAYIKCANTNETNTNLFMSYGKFTFILQSKLTAQYFIHVRIMILKSQLQCIVCLNK